MFLNDKNEFNTFMKTLHELCKNDPNYKVPDSWNSMASKAAIALSKSHENLKNDDSFNINTLNKMYKSTIYNDKSDIYTNYIKSFFYGTIRDELEDIVSAIHFAAKNKDTDIYNFINSENDGALTGVFDDVVQLEYHPDDSTNNDRIKILETYASFINKEEISHFESLYITNEDINKGQEYVSSVTAFYMFREAIKDTFMVFCTMLGEYVQSEKNYLNILGKHEQGKLTEFLFDFINQRDNTLIETMFYS